MSNSGALFKPGDLVMIEPRPFLGRRETIGMIIESGDCDDPIHLIPVKVMAKGKITYVGKEYIKLLKNNTHASKIQK